MSRKNQIQNFLVTTALVIATLTTVAQTDSTFFANDSIQRTHPEAFVLQPESENFLRALPATTMGLRNDLVEAIQPNPALYTAIQNWESLSIEEQIPFLRQVFALEVKLMKITAPQLVIDAQEIPGRAAFFDFNLEKPDAGRVLLNPEVLNKMPKYASLALLIHETRHSAQFQMAFAKNADKTAAKAYLAAFQAQKQKPQIRSFCDFLTLANEFEAFQFGNDVLGRLTQWKVDMPDMGSFASQYGPDGKLKVDLLGLIGDGRSGSLLEKFNDAENEQCRILGACK